MRLKRRPSMTKTKRKLTTENCWIPFSPQSVFHELATSQYGMSLSTPQPRTFAACVLSISPVPYWYTPNTVTVANHAVKILQGKVRAKTHVHDTSVLSCCWPRSLGGQLTGDVINAVEHCHFFLPCPRSPSQPQDNTARAVLTCLGALGPPG